MDDAGLDAQRIQGAHAADAEQRVLAQPHAGIADVQARRDPAVGEVVLGPVGIEQQQRHAADVHAPDLGDDRALADRHLDAQRLAVVAGDQRGGHALRIGLDPVLVLPARGVDPLAEVAVAVHEADRDQRQPHVRRLLEDVAGEHPEAAGVDRQGLVDRVLGAEEGGGAVLGDGLGQPRLGDLLGDRAVQVREAREEVVVAPPARRGGAAPSPRSAGRGFRGTAPSAGGRRRRGARVRRASTTSGSCRRDPRAARAAQAAASAARQRPHRCRRNLRSPLLCSERDRKMAVSSTFGLQSPPQPSGNRLETPTGQRGRMSISRSRPSSTPSARGCFASRGLAGAVHGRASRGWGPVVYWLVVLVSLALLVLPAAVEPAARRSSRMRAWDGVRAGDPEFGETWSVRNVLACRGSDPRAALAGAGARARRGGGLRRLHAARRAPRP